MEIYVGKCDSLLTLLLGIATRALLFSIPAVVHQNLLAGSTSADKKMHLTQHVQVRLENRSRVRTFGTTLVKVALHVEHRIGEVLHVGLLICKGTANHANHCGVYDVLDDIDQGFVETGDLHDARQAE
jgi:hypothetical protein